LSEVDGKIELLPKIAGKLFFNTLLSCWFFNVFFRLWIAEGWELQALRGASRHIANDYPALAISVYHHAGDFWRVYKLVMSIRRDYKVLLRHYTEGWSETVMFFLPIK